MRKTVFIVFIALLAGLNLRASDESKFWEAVYAGDFEQVAELGESLGQEKIDYLFLSAIANHLNYDYLTFHGMSQYYHQAKNGDYSTLEQLLLNYYKEENPASNVLLGIVKNSLGNLELKEAQHYFHKSIKLEQNNPIAYNYLAMIENSNGRYDIGISHAEMAIKQDSTYPEPYNNLALALSKKGKDQEAVEYLLTCIRTCPKNTFSTYINYIRLVCEERVTMVDNSMFGVPGFKNEEDRKKLIAHAQVQPNSYLDLIDQFIQYNNMDEAGILLEAFKPDEESSPRYYHVMYGMGMTIKSDAMCDSALSGFKKANAFEELLDIGNQHMANQEFELAQKVYEKGLELNKSDGEKMKLYSNLGGCYLQLVLYDKAIETMKKALEITPTDDITLTNIGIGYALKEDKQTAREYLQKAKEHCTSDYQMQAIDMWMEKTKD